MARRQFLVRTSMQVLKANVCVECLSMPLADGDKALELEARAKGLVAAASNAPSPENCFAATP